MNMTGFLRVTYGPGGSKAINALEVESGPQFTWLKGCVCAKRVTATIPSYPIPKLAQESLPLRSGYYEAAFYLSYGKKEIFCQEDKDDIVIPTTSITQIKVKKNENIPQWFGLSYPDALIKVNRAQNEYNQRIKDTRQELIEKVIERAITYLIGVNSHSFFYNENRRLKMIEPLRDRFREILENQYTYWENLKDKIKYEKEMGCFIVIE